MKTSPVQTFQVAEHQKLLYSELGAPAVAALERLSQREATPLFHFHRKHLQARQFVGLVQARDVRIEILPKIFDCKVENLAALVLLLDYTRRLRLRPTGLARYSELGGRLLEIWIRHFAEQLNVLLRRHRRSEYVEIRERSNYLKGRLLIRELVSGQPAWSRGYPCRFEVFSGDYRLNQILRFCNRLLLRESPVPSTAALMRENDALLSDVSDALFQVADVEKIQLNRLNRHYEPVLDMCRVLLRLATLDFRAGRIAQMAFVFDMNRLFEEFVAEFVARHWRRIRIGGDNIRRVRRQHYLGRLFGEFRMAVDLIVEHGAGRRLLVDTKYKVLSDDGRSHSGLSQSDFYQMHGYARAGWNRYDEILLLYPRTDESGPVEERYSGHGVSSRPADRFAKDPGSEERPAGLRRFPGGILTGSIHLGCRRTPFVTSGSRPRGETPV